MDRIIVVGAGIVGASVAYALSQKGVPVTVLEAQRPAAGTSRASFAWPNANEKLPREYFALNAAGLAEHHVLADTLGGDWFHPTGNLEVVTGSERRDHQHAKVARLQDWGYRAELISEVRARELVPDLALPDSASYAFYPDEGWVAAPVLIHRLLEVAQASGATVRFPMRVDALDVQNGRVAGVIVDGEHLAAGLVIDCTGPAAGRFLDPLGISIARQRSPGLLVVTDPVPTCLSRVVHAPGVHLRPDGAGRVLIGSEDVDATLPEEGDITEEIHADSSWCRELLRRAQAVLPVLAGARIEAVRLGWRPLPADGLSAVGSVPGLSGYYLVFTHSGVTLGPRLGRLVAGEVVTGQACPELAPFRPGRLLEGHEPARRDRGAHR